MLRHVALVLPESALSEWLRVRRLTPVRTLGLGIAHLPDSRGELLAREFVRDAPGQLLLIAAEESGDWPKSGSAFLADASVGIAAVLRVDFRTSPPRASGRVRWGESPVRPLDTLRIVGHGAADIDLCPPDAFETLALAWSQPPASETESRLRGCLPSSAWDALSRTRILVVGCGGTGSMLAEQLVRLLGSESQLTLMDPDTFEPGNVAAWAFPTVAARSLGQSKARVLAETLADRAGADRGCSVRAVPSAMDHDALSAQTIKEARTVFCCVDDARARAVCGFLCAVYERDLIVVETSVVVGGSADEHRAALADSAATPGALPAKLLDDSPRTRLADVRLILPGRDRRQPGCLLCLGGIGPARVGDGPFWRERAGSFPAWNAQAVSLAIRIFSDFLSEICESAHWRCDEIAGTVGSWRRMPSTGHWDCPWCARIGGGDAAWRARPWPEIPAQM